MNSLKKITSALISIYSKENIDDILLNLNQLNIKIYSTGGTYDYIKSKGYKCIAVEDLTTYPSIFGGRVKTLHPKVFGGILYRRNESVDIEDARKYEIPAIDLVIVDLYPFEKTLMSTTDEEQIIEKIDIGGISLIRASAKNFEDVLVVPDSTMYLPFLDLLKEKNGFTSIEDRRYYASQAFNVSSHYDTHIFNYFNKTANIPVLKESLQQTYPLRYGENPHQQGVFFGDIDTILEQMNGKSLSYNNLVDVDAAFNLIDEFEETSFVIIKHTNACGVASRSKAIDAWKAALEGDPISAFGGVIITNVCVDLQTAKEINNLFFEVIIAPSYEEEALNILKSKKNRIILKRKAFQSKPEMFRSLLNGVLKQEKDIKTETLENINTVTNKVAADNKIEDLLFANKLVKHTKSNAIVIAKNKQLLGSGMGQTSRIDALKHAIAKAHEFKFDLKDAVLASDAFFPFSDCVEMAYNEGINTLIQPGGSIRDEDSIVFCNSHDMAMIFTGQRHFKH